MNRYKRTYIAKATRYWAASGMALAVSMSIGGMSAQSGGFVPFDQFLAGTAAAASPGSLDMSRPEIASRPGLANPTSFGRIRQHILDMYQGVQVRHSYLLGSQIFDCVPIEQQPAVRIQGGGIAPAPPPLAPPDTAQNRPSGQAAATQQLQASGSDAFGNALQCEEQTIPMRRITLEDLTRFKSLDDFFSKGPGGAGRAPAAPIGGPGSASNLKSAPNLGSSLGRDTDVPPSPAGHEHAFTYQHVNNLGGNSILNLWSPLVYTGLPLFEQFNLSQMWVLGYGGGTLQTVEAGWQNYPAKYGSQNAALFVYSTRDNYKPSPWYLPTTGCYNLECGTFVQVNNSWALGAPIGSYSTGGGAQYELPIQWLLYAGNWWLKVNGTWIGYYPGSFYLGGQLSRNATDIQFGGETASQASYYGPMGSGAWANAGFQHAAYQRNIYYTDTANNGQWASLGAATECTGYSFSGPAWGGSWGIYFFFGGPGGAC
jgi:hypothetical protein